MGTSTTIAGAGTTILRDYVTGISGHGVQVHTLTGKAERKRAFELQVRVRLSTSDVEHAKALHIAKTGATRL